MTEQRRALHDQVEQIRDQDIGALVSFINRVLQPSDPVPSQRITSVGVPPGSKAAAEIEEQRQRTLTRPRATHSDMIRRAMGETLKRHRIDVNKILESSNSWSVPVTKFRI